MLFFVQFSNRCNQMVNLYKYFPGFIDAHDQRLWEIGPKGQGWLKIWGGKG